MLLDHFHPPLSKLRHWSGFLSGWAGNLAFALNRELPKEWFAEPYVGWSAGNNDKGVEVRVYRHSSNPSLAGVIRFVTPFNEELLSATHSFLAGGFQMLAEELGLVVVDIVTSHEVNLHWHLLNQIDEPDQQNDPIYTSAYHPVKRNGDTKLDISYEPLGVGDDLISMPLFLKNGPRARVNLSDTYRQTLRELRYPQP